jgi:hypothetical protein
MMDAKNAASDGEVFFYYKFVKDRTGCLSNLGDKLGHGNHNFSSTRIYLY